MKLKLFASLLHVLAIFGLFGCKKNKPDYEGFNTFKWAIQGNDELVSEVLSFDVDLYGNTYAVLWYGTIGSGATFEKNGSALTLNDPFSYYLSSYALVKFNALQEPEWVYYLDDVSTYAIIKDVVVTGSGTSYILAQGGSYIENTLFAIDANGNEIPSPEYPGRIIKVAAADNDKLVIASKVTENETFTTTGGASYELNPGIDAHALVLTYYDMGVVTEVAMHSSYRFSMYDIEMNDKGEVAVTGSYQWIIQANSNTSNPTTIASNSNDTYYGFLAVFNADGSLKWSDDTWVPSNGHGISIYEVDINNAGELAYSYTRPISVSNDSNTSKVFVGLHTSSGERTFAEIYERNTGEEWGYNAEHGHVAINEDGSFYVSYRGSEYSEYKEVTTQLILRDKSGVETWRQEILEPVSNVYKLVSDANDDLIIGGRITPGGFVVNGDSLEYMAPAIENQKMLLAKFSK